MSKSVLLVEDDLDLQRIYSEKLGNSGFKVNLAIDATQGFSAIKNLKPSLILLDIMLPGKMNGFELLKKIKSEDDIKNIPVIVITNLDTEKDEAIKLGAIDYFIKANIELSEIVEKVKKFSS
jgi:two-component system, OmpR family, alkaline phosphatase synthesis response regulator PhoP